MVQRESSSPSPLAVRIAIAAVVVVLLLGVGGFLVWATLPARVSIEVEFRVDDGGAYPVVVNGRVVGTTPFVIPDEALASYSDPELVPATWPPPSPPGRSTSGGGGGGDGAYSWDHTFGPAPEAGDYDWTYHLRILEGDDEERISFTYHVLGPDGYPLESSGQLGRSQGGFKHRERSEVFQFAPPEADPITLRLEVEGGLATTVVLGADEEARAARSSLDGGSTSVSSTGSKRLYVYAYRSTRVLRRRDLMRYGVPGEPSDPWPPEGVTFMAEASREVDGLRFACGVETTDTGDVVVHLHDERGTGVRLALPVSMHLEKGERLAPHSLVDPNAGSAEELGVRVLTFRRVE